MIKRDKAAETREGGREGETGNGYEKRLKEGNDSASKGRGRGTW